MTDMSNAEFIRDLAARMFRNATPAMGFDQGDTDRLYVIANRLAALEQAGEPVASDVREALAGEQGEQCERCQGNGEIVTDWDRYMHAHDGDVGDEAVADCPDCSGTGRIEDEAPLPTLQRLGQEFDAGEAKPVAYRFVHLDYAGRKVSRYGAHPERVNGHDPIETHPLYAHPPKSRVAAEPVGLREADQ